MGAASHHRRLVGVVVLAAFLVAGCGSSSKKSTTTTTTAPLIPRSGGIVTDVATFNTGDPAHIDPALATDAQSGEIASLIFEGLTRTDPSGAVQPALASSWTVTPDNTQWTFTLRADVAFDNATPVLPSSFATGWARALKLDGPASVTNIVKTAVADDAAHTLTVTLTRPAPDFVAMVAIPAFSPVPMGTSADSLDNTVMIGDGPFKMSAPWAHSDNVTLVRNDAYYATKPYIDGVTFKITKDFATANTLYNTAKADFAAVDPTRIKDVAAPDNVVNEPLLATDYWAVNAGDSTLGGPGNLLLRQAIATTMDHKGMSLELFRANYTGATGWAPPATPGYQVRADSGSRNVEGAKDLLRQWNKPLPTISLQFPDNVVATAEANTIKSNLNDIGISATLVPLDAVAFKAAVAKGQVQLFYGSWQAPYESFDAMLLPFIANNTDANIIHYNNPAFDSEMNAARTATSADTQALAYQKAESIMLGDQPVVPNEWLGTTLIKSDRLQNIHVNPLGFIVYQGAWLRQ